MPPTTLFNFSYKEIMPKLSVRVVLEARDQNDEDVEVDILKAKAAVEQAVWRGMDKASKADFDYDYKKIIHLRLDEIRTEPEPEVDRGELWTLVHTHEQGMTLYTFVFRPAHDRPYPDVHRVGDELNLNFEPTKGETMSLHETGWDEYDHPPDLSAIKVGTANGFQNGFAGEDS